MPNNTGPMTKHDFWGAGEPDCPREIKTASGELWKLRCKNCGQDNPRDELCRLAALSTMHGSDSGALRGALVEARDLLNRYRQETPLGHQPHMIAHKADATLAKIDAALNLSSETGEPQ